METIRWGMIGCGGVAEVKSGPALQKANGSALVAVMRRDREKAEDYARRHHVARVYTTAGELIDDPEVDAVYVATPPSSHCELALKAAAAGKPCLVEKPMAMNHGECLQMIEAFRTRQVTLWVAYYRRALPRFLKMRELLREHAIGELTSIHVSVCEPLATGEAATAWRLNRDVAGAGLFLDLASHIFDIIDFAAGPIGRLTDLRSIPATLMRWRMSLRPPSRSGTPSWAPESGISMRRQKPIRSCSPALRERSPLRCWATKMSS